MVSSVVSLVEIQSHLRSCSPARAASCWALSAGIAFIVTRHTTFTRFRFRPVIGFVCQLAVLLAVCYTRNQGLDKGGYGDFGV